MSKINAQTEGGSFDLNNFFTGLSGFSSGQVSMNGKTTTLVVGVSDQANTSNLDKQPAHKDSGNGAHARSIASYYTAGKNGRNIPALQLSLHRYNIQSFTRPKK